MDVERRRRIEELFEAALEQPPDVRAGFLAEACGGDTELRAEVDAMLAGHGRAAGALERPVAPLAASLLDRRLDERLTARRIGPYRVLRELGRGGMGVVYLAERDDGQYRRRVAIKLVRSGFDDGQIHRRFLAERQILASLNHPNIAQLLEGGVADGQLPYLVMEYVEGVPITSYCDKHRLSIDARVRLFQQVCAAVHHAHQNLVIHRDLKPLNIVVDGQGNVKLLDFGIAKLLNPALGPAEAPFTRLAQWVMTPEYASPEQVRGESLTTASDIYSLGVILYELLAGHRPYELTTGAPPDRVVELVCERDPERPSTRAAQTEVVTRGDGTVRKITPAEVSAARETSPDRLPKQLRGDLDAIVMMALRKEPGRRYGSAAMLSDDLQRYLDGLPVQAHSGSRSYQARKFLRRHRVQATAAALVGVSLLAGTGVAMWQAALARSERDRAETARFEAETARTEAEAIADFLMGMFEASDPDRTQGGDTITARELLERGIGQAEALADQPLVQARMFDVVGRVYQSMGQYDRAQPLLERAVDLEIEQRGRQHLQVAAALVHLAEVLRRRAQYDSAQALLREAEAIQAAALGPDDPSRAETLHELSRVAVHRGDVDAAERWARDALALRRRTLGTIDPASIASLTHLGTVLRARGDLDGAEATFREAIQARWEGGAGAYLGALLQLADLQLHERGRSEEAAATYRQAVAALRADTDPDPSHMVRALGGLARTLENRGDVAGAESLLREALELRRNTYGPEHPLVSAGMIHLAGLFERTQRFAEAEALFRQVADLDGRMLGESHPTHAGTLTAIGRVLIAAGRYSDADTVLERAAAIRVAALGPDHPLVARTLRQQGEAKLRQGDYVIAESMLRRALAIKLQHSTPESNEVRQLHSLLAELYSARGEHEEAERYGQLARQP